MRFWEIADARNPVFFQTKCVPERRWFTSAVRRARDGLVCGRIILGPWSDRFRIVNGVSSVFRACAVDRIPLWFATVGSFPQCKWDCKWDELPMEFWRKSRTKCVFGASDFPSKNPFKKCFKIVFFSLRRRDSVLELQFPTPLRVVLLCFATQSPQIAL